MENHPTGGLFPVSSTASAEHALGSSDAMAEESAKIPFSVASTAVVPSISTNKWLTHLPVFAKCNIFNGNNLLVWERTVQAALRPRKIIHHLTEDGPHEVHPDFMKWTMEEEFVFAWLLDSLAPEHQAQYVSCDTSRKLWESIQRNHSKQGDKSKIIDLITKSFSLKQGDKDIITYSNELRVIHNELDHCYPLSTDPVARAREATTRLCIFLQGLRPEFEIVRSQLFNREVEPTFDEAVSKVKGEESRLKALQNHIESSAFLTKGLKNSGQNQQGFIPNQRKNDNEKANREALLCTFCNRRGHSRDRCWTLHGRPPHIEARAPSRANIVQNSGGGKQFGNEGSTANQLCLNSSLGLHSIMTELQSLKSMMNSTATVIGSTSMANSGKHQILASISLFTKDVSSAWILDSGATDHMTFSEKSFESYETLAPGKNVQTADGTLLPVVGVGTMKMQPIGTITNVLHVPNLFINLISVQKVASLRAYSILFDDIDAYLCHKELGWKIGLAKVQRGLYYIPCHRSMEELKVVAVKSSSEEEIMDIHRRMGHPSFYLLNHMYSHLFKGIDISTIVCDACQLGKFKRATFPPTDHRKEIPFQLIHFDVWGPSPQTDILGKRYFLVCTDDYSRYSWLFLLKDKTEVTSNIKNLCKLIKRQFEEDVRGIRTDNARDFLNTELKEFLESEEIKHETSCPYTPQQNGLAERKIGDIVDKSRTFLIQGNIPTNLWGFAVMTAIHLINRLPSKVLDFRSPIDLLEEYFPNIKLKTGLPVKVFGCVCYVHNPKYKQNKWNAKALKCVFLGYSTTQKGYKAYHPLTRKYIVSKDVLFEEKCF